MTSDKQDNKHTQDQPIDVSVETEYLPMQSEPDNDRYVFAYHITITNHTYNTHARTHGGKKLSESPLR